MEEPSRTAALTIHRYETAILGGGVFNYAR
jgi:hypothetical protein